MKSLSVIVVFLASISSPGLAGEEPPSLTPKELISEGVSLHDAGKFDDAIRRYKRALEIEPENAEALYELATTYAATKQYDLCEATARQGLKRTGSLEGALVAVVGTCLSEAGKTREALHTFEEGLAKHPNDPGLNFNIAMTLVQEGKPQQAVPHLQKVIEAKPFYSSPYLRVGEIFASEGRQIEGMWFLMRFVSLEVNSGRAATASAKVFELLTSGVSAKSEKEVTITLSPDMEKTIGELAPLELARTLAAASMYLEEAQAQSKAQRVVSALDSFVKMADEMTRGEEGIKITRTFVWKRAATPIVQLQKKGTLECFGYFLAARAGFDGAEEWLKENAQKMRELESALAELSH